MIRLSVRFAVALGLSALGVGCGPMQMPMAVRLDPEGQAGIDDAWNKAFEPVDRLDSQQLLDALLCSQGYQVGVDRLMYRSEKHCDAGLIVMEINCDRARPEWDRFTVTLTDLGGRLVRHEHYSRKQVEGTYQELFIEAEQLANAKDGTLTPDRAARKRELQSRLASCQSLFPDFSDDAAEAP